MAMTIDLSPDVERQLRERAAGDGVEPAQLAARLVGESLSFAEAAAGGAAADNLRQLFAQWEAQDPVTGPEDLAERERELEDFKAGMNAASTRGHMVFP